LSFFFQHLFVGTLRIDLCRSRCAKRQQIGQDTHKYMNSPCNLFLDVKIAKQRLRQALNLSYDHGTLLPEGVESTGCGPGIRLKRTARQSRNQIVLVLVLVLVLECWYGSALVQTR
jgi:hypothetical protein